MGSPWRSNLWRVRKVQSPRRRRKRKKRRKRRSTSPRKKSQSFRASWLG